MGRAGSGSLRSPAVADTASPLTAPIGKQLPSDLSLTPLVDGAAGQSRPLMDWLTTFHLASVILDPYTNESSWILRTATRILEPFRGSDAAHQPDRHVGPERCEGLPRSAHRQLPRFLRPRPLRREGDRPQRTPRLRVHPRRRRRRRLRAGLEAPRMGRRRRCHRRDHLVVVDHGARAERPGLVPRFAGARLRVGAEATDVADRPTPAIPPDVPRDLPIVDALDDVRRALQDHRRAIIVAPPGAGKTTVVPLALLAEPWLGDGRIVMLEPRRLATRAAARRMASHHPDRRRRPDRLPDPRRAPHRSDDADRGRHRRRADSPPAERPRAPGCRGGDLRRGPRAQPHRRRRAGVHHRGGRHHPPRPRDRGDVGDTRHRGPATRARRARRHERRADVRRRHPLAAPHLRPRRCRWWPCRWLIEGTATAAPARRASTDRARRGRRGPARGRIRRGRRARVPARHRRDPTHRTRPRRGIAESRRRVRARRSTLAGGAGPGVGTLTRRAPPGRVVDRHRRDVAHRRRRADRDRRRPRPRAALRRPHGTQPADDRDHQPLVGRSTRRPRRTHRAGRGVPAVEQDRARHTAAPPVARDRPGRPRRLRPRAGGLGNRRGRPGVHRRATGALARTGAGAARRPARDRPGHHRSGRHRSGGWLDHPARPIDARAPGPSSIGTDGGDRAVDTRLHRRLARRRARRVPRSTRRPPGRPVVARRRDRRLGVPRRRRPWRRVPACATGPPTSPAAPASGSTSIRSTSTAPAPRSCWPIPTGSPAADGRASSNSVPARRRGCPTTIHSARRHSWWPPTSTGGALGRGSGSPPHSMRPT